jgi:uncharacterized protein (TIGR02594 family)
MVRLFAFCRSRWPVSLRIVGLALCSAAVVASVSPASARSHHAATSHRTVVRHHHATVQHGHVRHASRHRRHYTSSHHRQHRLGSSAGLAATASTGSASTSGYSSSNVVAEARRYIGGNPTSRGRLWCARFMNMVLQHTGHRGTGSDMARSFASYGHRLSGPQVGAIAVMGRRGGGGHVGIVSGIDQRGNPILVSGNNGNRVREAPVSRGRIYAYVMPTS